MMKISAARFIKSASKLSECPAPDYPEIAIIGRSNVGKSTLINFLLERPLAKASDKPGKTQLINYFLINDRRYFVDLPGYGYAKSSRTSRAEWIDTTQEYFLSRRPHILLLIDGSIPPQEIDLAFIQALEEEDLDFTIILSKIDKCNQKTLHHNSKQLELALQESIGRIPTILRSSSIKKFGRAKVLELIEEKIQD